MRNAFMIYSDGVAVPSGRSQISLVLNWAVEYSEILVYLFEAYQASAIQTSKWQMLDHLIYELGRMRDVS